MLRPFIHIKLSTLMVCLMAMLFAIASLGIIFWLFTINQPLYSLLYAPFIMFFLVVFNTFCLHLMRCLGKPIVTIDGKGVTYHGVLVPWSNITQIVLTYRREPFDWTGHQPDITRGFPKLWLTLKYPMLPIQMSTWLTRLFPKFSQTPRMAVKIHTFFLEKSGQELFDLLMQYRKMYNS